MQPWSSEEAPPCRGGLRRASWRRCASLRICTLASEEWEPQRFVPFLPGEFPFLAVVNGAFFFIISTNQWVLSVRTKTTAFETHFIETCLGDTHSEFPHAAASTQVEKQNISSPSPVCCPPEVTTVLTSAIIGQFCLISYFMLMRSSFFRILLLSGNIMW